MALLSWTHASTVGVKAMDDQHGILMDAMNELRLTLMNGGGHGQTGARLEQLIDFTRKHFQSEERLLEQQCFPGLPAHRAGTRTDAAGASVQRRRAQSGCSNVP